MNNLVKALCGTVAAAVAAPALAATLIVDANGTLTGATGVEVDGVSYDVTFNQGSCAALFEGCNAPEHFAAANQAAALQFGQALLDQVFVDTAQGNFDTQPSLTRGCIVNACVALIPFATAQPGSAGVAGAYNYSSDDDFVQFAGTIPADWVIDAPDGTFARFTRSAVAGAVPEPTTWAMMLMGFGAVGGAMRSTKRLRKVNFSYA